MNFGWWCVSKIWLKDYQGKRTIGFLKLWNDLVVDFWTMFRFLLDGKKVYESTLVCPFGILMGWKRRLSQLKVGSKRQKKDTIIDLMSCWRFFGSRSGISFRVFLGAVGFWSKIKIWGGKKQEMGRHEAPRAHIFCWGTNFSSRFRSKRQKSAQTSFLMKNNIFKNNWLVIFRGLL